MFLRVGTVDCDVRMNCGMSTVAVYCRQATVFFDWGLLWRTANGFIRVASLEIDFQLRDGDPIDLHPKMAHALRPMRVGAIMAFEIKHWCDVLRESISLPFWKSSNG